MTLFKGKKINNLPQISEPLNQAIIVASKNGVTGQFTVQALIEAIQAVGVSSSGTMKWRGLWNEETTYQPGDVVRIPSSSDVIGGPGEYYEQWPGGAMVYVSDAGPSQGQFPPNFISPDMTSSTRWDIIALDNELYLAGLTIDFTLDEFAPTPSTPLNFPITLHATDDSIPPLDAWEWELRNYSDTLIASSTVKNPQFTIPVSGYYHVNLTGHRGDNSDSTTRYVIGTSIIARAQTSVSSGNYPKTLTLTDASYNGTPTTRDWNVYWIINGEYQNNGNPVLTSAAQNPTLSVTGAGQYSVNFNVTDSSGYQSSIDTMAVQVADTGFIRFASTAYLSVPASTDWAVGTGDFTIEWTQLKTDTGLNTRLFSVGEWPAASIAVSLESDNRFIFWLDGANFNFTIPFNNILMPFAVTRQNGTMRLYANGILKHTWLNVNDSADDSTTQLLIGLQTLSDTTNNFGGYLKNFHFVKGVARYTGDWYPVVDVQPIAETKLLLKAATSQNALVDSGPGAKTVTSVNTTWVQNTP